MRAFVSLKRQAHPLRYLPLALFALALSSPLQAHDDREADHDHGHAHEAHNASTPDHDRDHVHDSTAVGHAGEQGHADDNAHGHADHDASTPDHNQGHAHEPGDHGRQAPQEWLERESPLPPSAGNLALGQEVYQRYCAACHGSEGRGDGVSAGVAGFVPIPTDLAQHGAGHAAGEYAWLVEAGNPQSAMPRFAGRLGEEEVWAVVLYVRHVLATDEGADHAH